MPMVGLILTRYLHPSPTYYESIILSKNEVLTFKYRVILHRGDINKKLVDIISQDYKK